MNGIIANGPKITLFCNKSFDKINTKLQKYQINPNHSFFNFSKIKGKEKKKQYTPISKKLLIKVQI